MVLISPGLAGAAAQRAYRGPMPITFAHPAAVLPLARARLPLSALAIGSMVPDLPLFVGREEWYATTHGPLGVFLIDVLVGSLLVGLWVLVLKDPMVDVLPALLRRRVGSPAPYSSRDWWLTAPAVCLGAVTHVIWDAFTHPNRWGDQHIAWLAQSYGGVLVSTWLHGASSVLGSVVLGWVVVRALARAEERAIAEQRLPRWAATVAGGVVVLVVVATGATSVGSSLWIGAYNVAVNGISATAVVVLVLAAAWHAAGLSPRSAPRRRSPS